MRMHTYFLLATIGWACLSPSQAIAAKPIGNICIKDSQCESNVCNKFKCTSPYSVDNGNPSLVYDKKNNIRWMRCSLGQTWTGDTCVGTAKRFTWEEAMDAVREYSYTGKYRWRLPTEKELVSLIHCNTDSEGERACRSTPRPLIDKYMFPNTPTYYQDKSGNIAAYWTSTEEKNVSRTGQKTLVYSVSFDAPYSEYNAYISSHFYVRPVVME